MFILVENSLCNVLAQTIQAFSSFVQLGFSDVHNFII